jgi:predicted Rossmann fold nucleotide-binding protein DprA/Smf involved in DNA uptake
MDAHSLSLARIQDCPGLGASALSRIVNHFNGNVPDSLYEQSADAYVREIGLPRRAAVALSAYRPACPAAYSTLNVRMLTAHDSRYPGRLRTLRAPPPVVSTLGVDSNLLTSDSFGVICSTGWEVEHPGEIKDAIDVGISDGYRCVAGHNRPVYQWALLAAKRTASQAVMVLDRGILTAFDAGLDRDPVAAARIWGYSFDTDHCTVLSPFRLRDAWVPANSVRRDEIVFALADTIIVMGIRPDGRIHRACLGALRRGQRVYAGPDAISVLRSFGALAWERQLPARQENENL